MGFWTSFFGAYKSASFNSSKSRTNTFNLAIGRFFNIEPKRPLMSRGVLPSMKTQSGSHPLDMAEKSRSTLYRTNGTSTSTYTNYHPLDYSSRSTTLARIDRYY